MRNCLVIGRTNVGKTIFSISIQLELQRELKGLNRQGFREVKEHVWRLV